MIAFLILFTIIANIFGFAGPLVDSINNGLGLHLSGLEYFLILFVIGLFFD
jgi:hypothetical protein